MADYKKSSVHCHSTMCDGKNTLQDMASAACAQGLTTLGFTGHSYTQRDREYCMSPSRTAQYKATIAKLKAEYRGKVDILCGIEWDILSEDKRTGYDYRIGSAHHLYGKNTGKYYEIDFRPQDLWDCINDDFDADPLAAVEAYFAEVEKVAAMKPDILCFDEPTSALDPELTGEVLKVIRGLAQQHTTMIIVTHEMAFARDVADQVIFMDGGVIVEQGPAREVIDNPQQERTRHFLARYSEQ